MNNEEYLKQQETAIALEKFNEKKDSRWLELYSHRLL